MKIAILSNININILVRKLSKEYDIYQPEGYGNFIEEMINPQSGANKFQPDCVFAILDGNELVDQYGSIDIAFEDLQEAVKIMQTHNVSTRFFISNIDIFNPFAEYVNKGELIQVAYEWIKKLNEIATERVLLFDLVELIEKIGREQFYSSTLWYLSSTPYSQNGISLLERQINIILRSLVAAKKKCIVLDMDNTLWGGVLGEDGSSGIKCSPTGEGKVYFDFQKNLKKIQRLGVILAISSKNNKEEVDELYETNKSMPLGKDDFAIIKANWEPKPNNIREIAEELNIGLDSMVFIDDNPAERERVRIELPGVSVPEFPNNIYDLNNFLKDIFEEYFFTISVTDEDRNKTKQYKENFKRSNAKSSFQTYQDYLEYLKIEINLYEVKDRDIKRAAQLTQKTNQFNLTTKRYTEEEIQNLLGRSDYKAFICEAKDRFGEYGQILLVICKLLKGKCEIDTFLMSCRAMSRDIEYTVLNRIENEMKNLNISAIEGSYLRTKRNEPARDFYVKAGYDLINEENENLYFSKSLSEAKNEN